jgi:hypothetical protein
VLEHNVRARRFYERRGWAPDGTSRVVEFPPHPLDLGYARDLRETESDMAETDESPALPMG